MVVYFRTPGPENTDATIKAAKKRAENLKIRRIVVASLTGGSAVKVAKAFKDINKKIVCVTAPQGMFWNVGSMNEGPYAEIPSLKKIGDGYRKKGLKKITMKITEENEKKLKELDVRIVKGTIPLFSVSFSMRSHLKRITELDIVSKTLELISTGTLACAEITMMATDAGEIQEGEKIIVLAGTERGLDTCWIMRSSTSANLFHPKKGLRFVELIAKPRISVIPDVNSKYLKEANN